MPYTAAQRHPWTFGFVLGTGFFGLTAMGPIYNTYIPLLLHDLGLSAALIGFVMTWDNWLHLFIPAWAGARSDSTWTRWGRRRPWILAGAPVGMVLFALVPDMRSLAGLLLLLLVLNAFMSVVRAPGLALLGDLFAPAERSKANGVINLLGGLGAVTALVGSGYAYRLGAEMPFRLGALLM
jgi:maltose/moltooligosaccharide transporter